jgi:outer membrane receptor for ferric coprogen and ferric-rhodotorulic acid
VLVASIGVQDEAGFKSEFFKKRVSFTGAYFEISQTNVTVPNPDHQTDPNAPRHKQYSTFLVELPNPV